MTHALCHSRRFPPCTLWNSLLLDFVVTPRTRTPSHAPRSAGKGGFLVADTILVALAVLAFPILVDGAGAVSFGNGRLIDANASDAFAVSAADLDGDGDIDVVAALTENDEVFWYENVDGIGTFAERAEISPCCERARPT